MVRDPFSDDVYDVYHVMKGTGMGLPHSGELTDSCFAALVEITILSPRLRSKYGVKGYFRFRDDILAICAGLVSRTSKPLFEHMQRLARFYPLKAEWFRHAVQFLELDIQIVGGIFAVSHHLKDTALMPSLGTSSSHNPSVHLAWPRATVNRIARLCSTTDARLHAFDLFLDRLIENYAPEVTLRVARDQIHLLSTGRGQIQKRRSPRSWVVCGFHPQIVQALQRFVGSFNRDSLHRSLLGQFGFPNPVGISWSNSAPNLFQIVQKMTYGQGGR